MVRGVPRCVPRWRVSWSRSAWFSARSRLRRGCCRGVGVLRRCSPAARWGGWCSRHYCAGCATDVSLRVGRRYGGQRRGVRNVAGGSAKTVGRRWRVAAEAAAGIQRRVSVRCSWMSRTAIAPSPTADATRLVEPARTSPAANTPGRLVSRRSGGLANGHAARIRCRRSGRGR